MYHVRSKFKPPAGLGPPKSAKSAGECPYCGCDLRGCPPNESGLVTCPSCESPTLDPFAKRSVADLPSNRCENCGYDLSGISGTSPSTRCPECNAAFPAAWFSKLEQFPGYGAAIRRMFKATPYIAGVFIVLCILTFAWTRGTAGMSRYLLMVALCAALSAGEATMKGREIAWVCIGRRDRWSVFACLVLIGLGLSLAIWIPVGAIVVALGL
ncbi:MAG: hypothetical protein KF745_12280 [Phycisphaeraceae bacterium]|nr:hypothetical protein [Phycisphaeraceae bacterium]